MEVSIYTQTSYKGMKKQKGAIGYVISTMTSKGEATMHHIVKMNECTPNFAELEVVLDAVLRINKPCELKIYTNSFFVKSGIEKWMWLWKQNDWNTNKGEQVAYVDTWKLLNEKLEEHNSFEVIVGEDHQYRNWLRMEVEREKNAKPEQH